MSRKQHSQVSRRSFLRGAIGVGAAASVAHASAADAPTPASQAAVSPKAKASRLAYPMPASEPVDPALLKYELEKRIPCPCADSKRLVIADQGWWIAAGKSVCKVDGQGQLKQTIPMADTVRALTVAEDGTRFVAVRERIFVLNSEDKIIGTWEAPAKKAWFVGIAASESVVYVTDAGNRVVWRYDRAGKSLGSFALKNRPRKFVVPSPYFDIKLGIDGLLRVVDPGNHQVLTCNAEGGIELEWGTPGMRMAGFCGCCNPITIAVLNDGRVVTGEKGIPRVKVYSAHGVLEAVAATPEMFPKLRQLTDPGSDPLNSMDVAVNATERIHILDCAANELLILRPKKAVQTSNS